ncbi:MAG: GSCFA domain-containing protein [Flavobacteriales bacterium]|nr:GSCFA domain-containing protein [Flavobacteriales bacterium]
MKFTTPTAIPKSDFTISHEQSILLIGSCFAQNIGEKLIDNKFNVNINPFGIIYNPISVINEINRIINNQLYTEKELIQFNEKWISFHHHGSFSSTNKVTCLEQINTSLNEAHDQLKQSKTVFITVGSAWVYEYPDVGIVANCHKIPNKQFAKRLLSVKEILSAFDNVKESLKNINIVFTVSPVRHIKDGLHENNLSKSILHLAINNLVEQNDNYHYFPAYEIVIDELRDYRFYKDDLVHPTDLAINYIWNKFSECYFSSTTQQLNSEIKQLKAAINHRPFNFESEEHQQFISKQIEIMDQLSKQYSFLNFMQEKKSLLHS